MGGTGTYVNGNYVGGTNRYNSPNPQYEYDDCGSYLLCGYYNLDYYRR